MSRDFFAWKFLRPHAGKERVWYIVSDKELVPPDFIFQKQALPPFFQQVSQQVTSWWLNQPIWKNMRKSNWIISQIFGMNIKKNWNHHPGGIFSRVASASIPRQKSVKFT